MQGFSNDAVRQADLLADFNNHGLILFRDQDLTPEEEIDFMHLLPWDKDAPPEKLYGPLGSPGVERERYTRWRIPEHQEILLQGEGDIENHHGLSGALASGKPTREWHSDGLHELEEPPVATSMYAISSKEAGGDTLFRSGVSIFEGLSEKSRNRVESLVAHYTRMPSPMHKDGLGQRAAQRNGDGDTKSLGILYNEGDAKSIASAKAVSTSHPVVWEHPETKSRAVIIAPMWLHHISESGKDMSWEDSQQLSEDLLRAGERSTYRHEWTKGDFVVWDNRQLLHSGTATSSFSKEGIRLLHRIRLCGTDRPTGPACSGHAHTMSCAA
jgi:alpha-ketoglutarate-dependent taurine dioxygenase